MLFSLTNPEIAILMMVVLINSLIRILVMHPYIIELYKHSSEKLINLIARLIDSYDFGSDCLLSQPWF